MASRAGIPMEDLEFIQFHPTGMKRVAVYIVVLVLSDFKGSTVLAVWLPKGHVEKVDS